MTVTLANDDGVEVAVTVPDENPIDAGIAAKKSQVAATGDRSWRVLRARR